MRGQCRCCCCCSQREQAEDGGCGCGCSQRKQTDDGEPGHKEDDLLTQLGSSILASLQQSDEVVSGGTVFDGPMTKSWILGAFKLISSESQMHMEKLASGLCERITMSLASIEARQQKLFHVNGLTAVAASLTHRGCIFCDNEGKTRTKDLNGPVRTCHAGDAFIADRYVTRNSGCTSSMIISR
jgi:hypothetical protein